MIYLVYRIVDASEDCLQESKLRVNPEEEEHEEEHDGEELRDRELGQSVGVGDEGEPLAARHQVVKRDPGLLVLGAEDGEHEHAGDDGGEEVEGGDDGGGDVDLVLELVVAAEHKEAAPGDGQGEEHLPSCFPPDLSCVKVRYGYFTLFIIFCALFGSH